MRECIVACGLRPFRLGTISRLRWGLVFCLLLMVTLGGCVRAVSTQRKVPVEARIVKANARFQKEYVLLAGDQVEVVVRRSPEISRTVVVRPDGFITLPIIKDIRAAGLAPKELAVEIEKALAGRLVSPEVTVITINVRQQVVYVTGEVNTPAAVPLSHAPTILQAISLAGGMKRSASAHRVALIRLTADGFLAVSDIDVKGKGQPDPLLAFGAVPVQADDVIFVPENARSQYARFLDDFVNRPLGTLNSIIGTYVNFRLIELLSR